MNIKKDYIHRLFCILTIKFDSINEEIVFELPIHYRYQLPSDSNPFVAAPIYSPSVFVKCNSNDKVCYLLFLLYIN